jgi:hypothetical protein
MRLRCSPRSRLPKTHHKEHVAHEEFPHAIRHPRFAAMPFMADSFLPPATGRFFLTGAAGGYNFYTIG